MTGQTWRRIGVTAWLLALGVSTSVRCHVWRSDRSLWADAAQKAPAKPRPIINYGRAVELAGDAAGAEALYRTAISVTFDERRSASVRRFSRAAAETNIAHLYMLEGRMASAMRILDTTIAGWPEFPYAHYNRGAILWAYGFCDHAAEEYRAAFRVDSALPRPKGTCAPSSSTP